MKMNPNVAIRVQGNGNSLSLTNCRLFCCDNLWGGIIVEADDGAVSVTQNTTIEDAMAAIQNDVQATGVRIIANQSLFNRNVKGIYLEGLDSYTAAESPRIVSLVGTTFTVTSPLFSNAVPFCGIQTKNVLLPLSQFSALNNTNIQHGIYAQGSQTRLFVFNDRFELINRIGIYFTEGNLVDVRNSDFRNCRYGISMFAAEDLVCLSDSFVFNQNSNLDRAFIRISQPRSNNYSHIESCIFTVTGTNQTGYFTAVDVRTAPEVPTETNVRGNVFNLLNNSDDGASPTLKPSTGVKITGELIAGSDIDIEENTFNVNPGLAAHNIGVESSGGMTRNLMRIILNNFNCSGTGIRFDGSVIGTENQIVENYFNQVSSNPGTGADIAGFEGLEVCSNTVFPNSLETNYLFRGQSMSTDFRGNVTGSGDFFITAGATIGQQMDNDNVWSPTFNPGGTVIYHPYLLNDNTIPQVVQASKFSVTEPQSIYDQNTNTYTLLSLTHPDQVIPDVFPLEDAFFDQGPQDFDENCIIQFNASTPADAGDLAIAQGIFGSWFSQPAVGWDAEQYLYRKLNLYPGYAGAHSSFPTFLSTRANTTVGKFYNLEQKVQQAGTMPTELANQAAALQAEIAAIEAEIATLPPTNPPSNAYLGFLEEQRQKIEELKAVEAQFSAYAASKLTEAWNLLPGITTSNSHEWNKKRVYEIYIGSRLFQGGAYTPAQIADLKAIGQQCMEIGGKAVLMARGLLDECGYLEIRDIVRECSPPVEERSQPSSPSRPIESQISVLPNPAANFLILRAIASGTLNIRTPEGKTVQSSTFLPGDNRLQVNLQSGLYFFHCQLEDGTIAIRQVVIQR